MGMTKYETYYNGLQWHHFFFPRRVLKCQLLVGKLPWKIVSEWTFPFRPSSLFHLHSLGPNCHNVLDQVRFYNVNVAFQSSEKLDIELCSVSGSRLRGHRLEWHSVWRPSLLWQLRLHFEKKIIFSPRIISHPSKRRACKPSRLSPRSPIRRPLTSGSPLALSLSSSGSNYLIILTNYQHTACNKSFFFTHKSSHLCSLMEFAVINALLDFPKTRTR